MDNVTQQTLDLIKDANARKSQDALLKAYTQATGLVHFDLERPSKIIYPVNTPLRNMIPRVKGEGGTATNWRAITGIDTTLIAPGVQEGRRTAITSQEAKSYVAVYKTLGLEDTTTFEAQFAGEGFDDIIARMVEGLLRATMIQEENTILGGNTSLALGQPTAPTTGTAGTGGTIGDTITVEVSVVALTHEGFRTGSVSGGIRTIVVRQNADLTVNNVGGYSSEISANTTQVTGAGTTNVVTATVPVVNGAVAYAWFWGATPGAAQLLGAITTINSVLITTPAGLGTQQADDANLATDNSRNALVYDGILYLAMGAGQENPAAALSGSIIKDLGTGVAGTGTPLTGDGAGGINEIDDMLRDFWNQFELSPSHLIVNSEQLLDITKLTISGGAAPLFRFVLDGHSGGSPTVDGVTVTAGTVVGHYLNKYTMAGGNMLKVVLHPNMPPGTILFYSDRITYPLSNVSNILQLKLRREYYQIDWPLRNRTWEKGTYVDAVLQMYFPPAFGLMRNVGKA